jgi:hypothetical protein
MSYQVHPYPLFTSYHNPATNRTEYQASGHSPGMTVKQLWLGQILASIAVNPATMLDPETHVEYAIKLVDLAFLKSGG